jgi:SAM-dependent methyltransferase
MAHDKLSETLAAVDQATVTVDGERWLQWRASSPEFEQRVRFDEERLSDFLELIISSSDGERLLEIGSAPYILTAALVRAGFDVTANGLPVAGDHDTGSVTIETADRTTSVPLRFFDAESEFPFPDASFDVIVAGEIFEHLYRQPWMMFWEARRCLRPGGLLVISTPNGHALEKLYAWATRGSTGLGFNPNAPSVRHAREYSLGELREIAAATGFSTERIHTASYSHIVGGFGGRLAPIKALVYRFLKRRAARTSGLLANRGDTTFMTLRKAPGGPPSAPPDFMLYGVGDPRTGYNFTSAEP